MRKQRVKKSCLVIYDKPHKSIMGVKFFFSSTMCCSIKIYWVSTRVLCYIRDNTYFQDRKYIIDENNPVILDRHVLEKKYGSDEDCKCVKS